MEIELTVIKEFLESSSDSSHDELLMSEPEVCNYLRISKRLLRTFSKSGVLDFTRVRHKYYYTLGAIKALNKTWPLQKFNFKDKAL